MKRKKKELTFRQFFAASLSNCFFVRYNRLLKNPED